MASQSFLNSPTDSKRPAEMQDEMSDLIHKAKASRHTAPIPDDDESIEELLEKQLTCSICAEVYVDPILVLPCSHSFCGRPQLIKFEFWEMNLNMFAFRFLCSSLVAYKL
jgi:hypothetical protein